MLTKDYVWSLGIERIINYLRRSRQDEELERRTGEDTLKTQADLMDRVLQPLSVPYDQVAEIGSGDKISTRPIFQSVITDLSIGKYQAIAVKEISRMGRGSYTDMGIIYDLIVEKRIFVITPYKVYDPKNPADLRQIRFELFMSREEFETTRERLNGGRKTRALEGRWMSGKTPYGYDLDPTTKKLVINDEQAKVVRLIYDLYVNGLEIEGTVRDMRARAISTYLTRIGVPTPIQGRHWRPENVQYMLENDVYIGTVRYGKTETVNGKAIPKPEDEQIIVENAHEPIIDLETWSRAQEKAGNKAPAPRTRLDRQPYELTGLVRCSCGNSMIRQYGERKREKRTGEVSVYKREILTCKSVHCGAVNYRSVLEDIETYLQRLGEIDSETLAAWVSEELKLIGSQESHMDASAYTEKRRAELKRKLSFIYDRFEDGTYDRETFLARKAEVENELRRIELMTENERQKKHEDKVSEQVRDIQNKLKTFQETYYSLNRAGKNALLRKILKEVVVEKTSKGVGKKLPTYDIYPRLRFGV